VEVVGKRSPDSKGEKHGMAKYVAYIRFTDDTNRRLDTRPIHREYLKRLFEEGRLHESGPFTDDSGALIIYNAGDQDEAEQILAADPYTTTGGIIDSVTFHEWNRVIPAE
jgi:uncharacterized protein